MNICKFMALTARKKAASGGSSDANSFVIGGSDNYGAWSFSTVSNHENWIQHFDNTLTSGNATDIGDMVSATAGNAGVRGPNYGYSGGGARASNYHSNNVEYIDLASTSQNGTDKGDLNVSKSQSGGLSGPNYGYFCGGRTGTLTETNAIEYMDNDATSGNGTDKGDMQAARGCVGVSGATYGFMGMQVAWRYDGGTKSNVVDYYNTIDYMDIDTTTGNSSDKGDLNVIRGLGAGVYGSTYGYFCGGSDYQFGTSQPDNEIQYIDITTTSGNASDKGDLTVAKMDMVGSSGATYGFVCGGGKTGSSNAINEIDYFDVSTTLGNASDRGDLAAIVSTMAGV